MPQNIIFSEAEWAALADKLQDPFFQTIHEDNERAIAIMLEQGREDFWQLSGDLRATEIERGNPWRWRVIKHRLYRFAVSWRITGSEAALKEALRAVDVLIDPNQWHIQFEGIGLRHGDLRTADLWTCASFALEALHPALDDERREKLITLLKDWALPTYLKGIRDADWWRHADFNWGTAVHGAAGIAALTLLPDEPQLCKQVLDEVHEGIGYVINNMPAGGFWTEGLMYQTTTLGHLTDFIAALHRLTGDDYGLSEHSRLRDSFDSRLWMIGGDERPLNFSNCNDNSDEWRLPQAWWWANHCSRPDWAGFEAAYPRTWYNTNGIFLDLEMLWFREMHQPATEWKQPAGLRHGRELDWISWKRGETWLGFRSGFNGGNHNNRDLGQIIFGYGSERVLCDPGYGAGATKQHSCVTYAGDSQALAAESRIFRAREFEANGVHWLYVCCDLGATYPHVLSYHYRHVLASSTGTLYLLDDALSRRGRRLGAAGHLQFRLEPEATDEKKVHWRLKDSEHSYAFEFMSPVFRQEVEEWEWRSEPVYTLSFRPYHDLPRARVGVVFHAASEETPKETRFSAEGDEALVQFGDTAFRIDLSEGSCRLER